jgi:hypothetical protein
MADEDRARIYGAPDPDDQQPPAEQGLRGEQGAAKPGRTDLTHDEPTPDGGTIEIEEQSGTAFAEVTGAAGSKDSSQDK